MPRVPAAEEAQLVESVALFRSRDAVEPLPRGGRIFDPRLRTVAKPDDNLAARLAPLGLQLPGRSQRCPECREAKRLDPTLRPWLREIRPHPPRNKQKPRIEPVRGGVAPFPVGTSARLFEEESSPAGVCPRAAKDSWEGLKGRNPSARPGSSGDAPPSTTRLWGRNPGRIRAWTGRRAGSGRKVVCTQPSRALPYPSASPPLSRAVPRPSIASSSDRFVSLRRFSRRRSASRTMASAPTYLWSSRASLRRRPASS